VFPPMRTPLLSLFSFWCFLFTRTAVMPDANAPSRSHRMAIYGSRRLRIRSLGCIRPRSRRDLQRRCPRTNPIPRSNSIRCARPCVSRMPTAATSVVRHAIPSDRPKCHRPSLPRRWRWPPSGPVPSPRYLPGASTRSATVLPPTWS